MGKMGQLLLCPKCKNSTYNVILCLVDVIDEETGEEDKIEMWQLKCAECEYGNSYLDADSFASLEIEKAYIEEELRKEFKEK